MEPPHAGRAHRPCRRDVEIVSLMIPPQIIRGLLQTPLIYLFIYSSIQATRNRSIPICPPPRRGGAPPLIKHASLHPPPSVCACVFFFTPWREEEETRFSHAQSPPPSLALSSLLSPLQEFPAYVRASPVHFTNGSPRTCRNSVPNIISPDGGVGVGGIGGGRGLTRRR